MQATRAMAFPQWMREWLPAREPPALLLLVIGTLCASAFFGLLLARGGDRVYLLIALMLGLAWAAWALPHPDRVLKTMFLVTPLVNPGVHWQPFNLYLSSALILVAGLSTLVWALTAGGLHSKMPDLFRHRLAVPLFLFVLVNLLSVTVNARASLNEGIRVLLLLLQLYVVAFIVSYVATDKGRLSSFLPWLLAGGTLGAAAALVSAIQPGFAPWDAFGSIEGANATFRSLSRIQGAFLHPNNLGIFTAYLIVALIALASYFRKWAALLWLAGAVSFLVLVLTLSRGAWLGAVAGLGAIFLLQRRAQASGAVVVALGLLAFWLLFSQATDVTNALSQRISEVTPRSLVQRQDVWGPNLQAFSSHPILGVGPGGGTAAEAHSSYLQVLTETGVLGIMVYGALLLAVARELLEALTRTHGTALYHMAVAATGVWAAFLVIGLVHTSSAQVFSNWFPGLMLGLAMAINRLPNRLAPRQGGAGPHETS